MNLALPVEGKSTYKLRSVGACPSLSLFENLSAITLLLAVLIRNLSQIEVEVYNPPSLPPAIFEHVACSDSEVAIIWCN